MASSLSGQESCTVIGYLSGQDGAILPAWNYLSCPRFLLKPYNKSFIDQARSFKIAGYCPHSSFASLCNSRPSRSINTLGQYPAILTSHLVNYPYLQLSMLDFPLMLWVKLPVVERIHPQGSKFAMGVENRCTGDSELKH